MKRKPIPKKIRELVYQKYGGHCAYCGCPIEMKDMQVDHLTSVASLKWTKGIGGDEVNDISNLMPSCRQCNYYKDTCTIEGFRKKLATLMERVEKNFIYRLAAKYGMVREDVWDGMFYFEKIERDDKENCKQD